jgi:hypothetical protein
MEQRLRSFYHDTMDQLADKLWELLQEGGGMVIDAVTTGPGRPNPVGIERDFCTVVLYHPAPRWGTEEL